MKPINQSKSIVQGALILTLGAIVTKILSAIYRIPFQNIVGDTGFYIYQQVYPFYGVALVLATTGFPVVLSKLYSEEKNKENDFGIKRLMTVAALFLVLLGLVSFLVLFFGADWLARQMKDPELSNLLQVVSFFFLLIPFTAFLRGYFQGVGNMKPTALSQVGEQFVRVGMILFLAILLIRGPFSLYDVGAGAMFGSIIGGIMGLVILLMFIRKEEKRPLMDLREVIGDTSFADSLKIFKILAVQGFAVCISSMLLLLMQMADALNLYSLLVTSGIEAGEAKELKGIYDRGQPLIQLGTVVATSMSLALVPLISNERVKSSSENLLEKIQLAIRVSMAIGMGATAGLMTIMKPTNMMLFENHEGTVVLVILSLAIFLSSVVITCNAVLQGLGHTVFPAVIVLSGLVLKYFLNMLLVPSYGTLGAAIATNMTLLCIGLVLWIKLLVIFRKPLVTMSFFLKTLLAVISMVLVLKGYLLLTSFLYGYTWLAHERVIASFQALSAVAIGGVLYLYVMIRMRSFTADEILYLPFGSKLLYFFSKQNRR